MITGELKRQVDKIWDTLWTAGITSPVTVMEQITYLLFMKLLDDNQLARESNANAFGTAVQDPVFKDGVCVISEQPRIECAYDKLRWSRFSNANPPEMFETVRNYVFEFIKRLGGDEDDTAFGRYMKNAVFLIPTPEVLVSVVDDMSGMQLTDKDTMGDVYEELLKKMAAAGANGQFRTPKHIVDMIVALMRPTLADLIADPAMGSAGFLVSAAQYIIRTFDKELYKPKYRDKFKTTLFSGFDTDQSMLRIGAMNMMLHGVDNPHIVYQDSLSQKNTERDKERLYTVMSQYNMRNLRNERYLSWWTNFNLDYTKPFSQNTIMETGASAVLGRNSQLVQWDTMNFATNQWIRDSDRTFSTRMVDNELTAYVTMQQKIHRFTLKGGVRVYRKWKQANFTDLPVETSQYDVDKAFWDFIPSFHASYATENGHNFTLSYTRRFTSPGCRLWSTYAWLEEESYELGDPDLRFSHTHNLEGGWTMYKGWGSVGLTGYLRANTDEIQQFSDVAYHPYYGRIVSFSQWANIGDSRTIGAEANLTWRPKPFMNIRLYANFYDYYYNMEFRPGKWDKRHLPTFSGRLNVTGKLWNVLQIYGNARYSTAALSLMSKSQPSFQLDLGASSDLLKGRLSLFLNWQDILATAQSGNVGLNLYYQSNYSYTWGSRAVTVGATWRIGKMELQSRAREGVKAPTL